MALKPHIYKRGQDTIVESVINGKLVDTVEDPPKDMFGRKLSCGDIVVVNYGGLRWGNYLGVIESSEGATFRIKHSAASIKKYKMSGERCFSTRSKSRTKVWMPHLKKPKFYSNREEPKRFIIVPEDWLDLSDSDHKWCLDKSRELLG